jgi:Flp pilus assembly pilin Flp
MRTTEIEHRSPARRRRLTGFRRRLADDDGAIAIEYVIVAIALLAIAGAIAAALTTLGDDAVERLPDSVSEAGN